ncbi:hypothetical protein ACFE04_022335 [Oxalis oulophora]
MVDLDNSSTVSGDAASVSDSGGNQNPPPIAAVKKKRNLPGMPDPDAEVIALSPKTLLATNRFVCEICNKGFQRDQNLQLHRRGHNLPWKLRQRTSKEIKKRVYVCPESSCVHHDPSRALGDLTGIKKHFCRKHGEKKWKCDKCSKKYAVQSDWKAHSKICGTREYKCDCGTLFSRRDSFITHRAFCDALAEESAKAKPPNSYPKSNLNPEAEPIRQNDSPPVPELPPAPAPVAQSSGGVAASSMLQIQSSADISENPTPLITEEAPVTTRLNNNGSSSSSTSSSSNGSASSTVFASLFASSTTSTSLQHPPQAPSFSELIRSMANQDQPENLVPNNLTEPVSLCLSNNHESSIFGQYMNPSPQPAMSATALLQKAAQMGAAATNASLLRGFGIMSSSSPPRAQQENLPWGTHHMDAENNSSVAAGLGLGLDGGSGLKELMMGTPSVFGPKQTTLDFLGLGMAVGAGSGTGGLSALITSIGSGLDVAAASFGGGEFSGKDLGRSS